MFDSRGSKTAFTYDALDRLEGTVDPLGLAEVFEYDLAGNLRFATDR
ncbi:MAG: RHS repeat protein, partial [Bacteroidetes bacterium]|nr:RHS repeat protein [Bacteroidota bacterium]